LALTFAAGQDLLEAIVARVLGCSFQCGKGLLNVGILIFFSRLGRHRRADGRSLRLTLLQPRYGAGAARGATLGDEGHRGAVDQHVGVHPDVHARFEPDPAGDELVAGGSYDFFGERDRAGADGA
jgi:hypothetical protein